MYNVNIHQNTQLHPNRKISMVSEVSTNLNQSCSIHTFEDQDKSTEDDNNHRELEFCGRINQGNQVYLNQYIKWQSLKNIAYP